MRHLTKYLTKFCTLFSDVSSLNSDYSVVFRHPVFYVLSHKQQKQEKRGKAILTIYMLR